MAELSGNGEAPSGRPSVAPHFIDHRTKRSAVKEIGPSTTGLRFVISQSQIRGRSMVKNRPQTKSGVRCDDRNHTSQREGIT